MRRWSAIAVGVAALAAVGLAGGAEPQPLALVFTSTRAPDYHDEIYVLDTRTGARRNLSRNPTADVEATVSPDGRWVAFASDRDGNGASVWLAPSTGGEPRRLHAPFPQGVHSLAWSPDGETIAVLRSWSTGPSGVVFVVPRRGGPARRVGTGIAVHWLTPGVLVTQGDDVVARSPSGRVLWRRPGQALAASARGELALADGGRIRVVDPGGRALAAVRGRAPLVWSRGGSRLAYSLTGDGGIGVLERDGRRGSRILGRGLLDPRDWSPDGRRLLASRAPAYTPVLVSLDGRAVPAGVEEGVWARTGTAILGSTERGLAVWRPGSAARVLLPREEGDACPSRVSAIRWLDARRVVLQLGRGSKHDADLWTAAASGRGLRRLLRTHDWEHAPEWSPDGSRIVYESGGVHTHADSCSGPMTPHLRLVRPDGTADRALTPPDDRHFQQGPRWSPDGRKVAFHRTDLSELSEFGVFVVDVASGAQQRVTTGYGADVTWAPDGRRIAFAGRGVSVADLVTGTVTRVGPGESPEWSPDGSAIAHVRGGRVWLVAPDGTNARLLLDAPVVGALRWSRNGSRLAFGSTEGIVVVARSGRTLRTIRRPHASQPRFSRDGRTLAFVARPDQRGPVPHATELYLADVGTGRVLRLTRDAAEVGAPSWR